MSRLFGLAGAVSSTACSMPASISLRAEQPLRAAASCSLRCRSRGRSMDVRTAFCSMLYCVLSDLNKSNRQIDTFQTTGTSIPGVPYPDSGSGENNTIQTYARPIHLKL